MPLKKRKVQWRHYAKGKFRMYNQLELGRTISTIIMFDKKEL